MSTESAVPVEWIKKYIDNRLVKHGDTWTFINCMMNDWEKDCRLKDTKDILDELLSEHNFKSYNDYVEYAGKITALPRDDRLNILFKEKENE